MDKHSGAEIENKLLADMVQTALSLYIPSDRQFIPAHELSTLPQDCPALPLSFSVSTLALRFNCTGFQDRERKKPPKNPAYPALSLPLLVDMLSGNDGEKQGFEEEDRSLGRWRSPERCDCFPVWPHSIPLRVY